LLDRLLLKKTGRSQQRAPADFLEGLKIPLPSPEEQKVIVEGVLAKRRAVEEERNSIDRYRASVLEEIEREILTGKLS
jgi:restriction endonuclease S subunit